MVHICNMRLILLFSFVFSFQYLALKGQSAIYSDSLSVYVFMGEDCRICQYYTPVFKDLHEKYASSQIKFVGLFPNRYSTDEQIERYKTKYGIPFDLKREYFQTKAKKFDVRVTPEVVVFDEKQGIVLYQGRIDDSYVTVGKRRQIIKNKDLDDALQSIILNKLIKTKETTAIGCFVNYVKQ